jgi:hypothetical protein
MSAGFSPRCTAKTDSMAVIEKINKTRELLATWSDPMMVA